MQQQVDPALVLSLPESYVMPRSEELRCVWVHTANSCESALVPNYTLPIDLRTFAGLSKDTCNQGSSAIYLP